MAVAEVIIVSENILGVSKFFNVQQSCLRRYKVVVDFIEHNYNASHWSLFDTWYSVK